MPRSGRAQPSIWLEMKARLSGYEALVPVGPQTVVEGNKVTYKASFFLVTAGASSLLLFLLVVVLLLFSSDPAFDIREGPYVRYHLDNQWPGWSGIEHMIVFGDSWSMTGFKIDGAQPSVENPLGNPEYPGLTSSNIANWVDYLIYDYNQSVILTADFAIGGATVADVVSDDWRSMKSQITKHYAELHHNSSDILLYDWKSNSTLIAIWIGINDIHNHYEKNTELEPIFVIYADLVEQLYQTGARNFLFIDVPPLEYCPLAASTKDFNRWRDLVADYNSRVDSLTWNLTRTYDDVNTFHFSSYQLLDDVMKNPCTLPESCGIKVTKDFCSEYSFGTVTGNASDSKCEAAVDEYLWLNPLHITTVAHKAIARAISDALKVG